MDGVPHRSANVICGGCLPYGEDLKVIIDICDISRSFSIYVKANSLERLYGSNVDGLAVPQRAIPYDLTEFFRGC